MHCQVCHGTGRHAMPIPCGRASTDAAMPLSYIPCMQCGGTGFDHCCGGVDRDYASDDPVITARQGS